MLDEVAEEWKQINDFPNYYISSLGNVRNDKNLIMKLTPMKIGYLQINLYENGKRKLFYHHQLIGLHFIPNPENFKHIDHINGIKNDNRLENLRWVLRSQNERNKKKKANCSSQYLGVCWDKKNKKWLVCIKINRKSIFLGYFATELDAFNAWKTYVIENGLQEFYSQVDFSLNQLIN
jgi:hypothetical protein